MDERERIEEHQRQSWEKALRNKLEDHDYKVRGELPPFVLPTREAKRAANPWWILIPAAAALLATLLLLQNPEPEIIIAPSSRELTDVVQSPIIEHTDNTIIAQNIKGVTPPAHVSAPVAIDEDKATIADTVDREVVITEPTVTSRAEEYSVGEKEVSPNKENHNSYYIPPTRTRSKKGVSIALKVAGLTGSRAGVSSEGALMYGSGGNMLFRQMDKMLYAASNPSVEDSYTLSEKAPIELGVSAIMPIAPRLSLESGLRYSLRRFVVSSSSILAPEQYEMDVHSIGVPLGIQYEAFQAGNWGVNIAGGFTGNIPVAQAVRGNQVTEQKAKLALDSYLTVGVDYKITPSVALGASVGGAYDIVPLNKMLFQEPSSRLRLKMTVGVKFSID